MKRNKNIIKCIR